MMSRFEFSETVTMWSAWRAIFLSRRNICLLLSSVVNGRRNGTRSWIVYTLHADFERNGNG